MFLAWRELIHSKSKFLLIVSLIALITYLVYFLISLAFGLATSYTNGIDKINAEYIVLSADSNDNAMMSMLTDDDYALFASVQDKAKLGLFPSVIINQNTLSEESKADAYVFGVEDLTFFLGDDTPVASLNAGEIVVDDSLQEYGYAVGDVITVPKTDVSWTIVGFATKATYQTAPIIYVGLQDWKDYRFSNQPTMDYYNAIITKEDISGLTLDGFLAYTTTEFANTLPGYTAQVLTFSLMIGFLIVIIAFVLGIFIYVLTVQKEPIFGVMKAQGIATSYIGSSVIIQTLIIMLFGAVAGFALTMISGYFLGGIVPFATNYLLYAGVTLAFFAFATVGGLFSVSNISKIDPLKAIK